MQPLRLQVGELWRSSPVHETGRQDNVTRSVCLHRHVPSATAPNKRQGSQSLGFLLEEHDTPGTVEACIAAN